MHVVERGTGTALVMIHGWGLDHRMLLPLDPVVEQAGGWRRIYLDLPGHGRSPAGGISSTQQIVDAVEAELAERLGDQPFAILGNSFGAMVARQIAHDRRPQVLGLATVAGAFIADAAARTLPERTVIHEDPAVIAALGELGAEYTPMAVVQTREHAEAFLTSVHPGLATADHQALGRIAEHYGLAAEPEDSSPAPFRRPCLFLTGRQDQAVGYQDAWARIEHYPRATFAALDAAGHNVHLEQPGPTGALIADWLQRMRRYP